MPQEKFSLPVVVLSAAEIERRYSKGGGAVMEVTFPDGKMAVNPAVSAANASSHEREKPKEENP